MLVMPILIYEELLSIMVSQLNGLVQFARNLRLLICGMPLAINSANTQVELRIKKS
jgi:hypothetical protein